MRSWQIQTSAKPLKGHEAPGIPLVFKAAGIPPRSKARTGFPAGTSIQTGISCRAELGLGANKQLTITSTLTTNGYFSPDRGRPGEIIRCKGDEFAIYTVLNIPASSPTGTCSSQRVMIIDESINPDGSATGVYPGTVTSNRPPDVCLYYDTMGGVRPLTSPD